MPEINIIQIMRLLKNPLYLHISRFSFPHSYYTFSVSSTPELHSVHIKITEQYEVKSEGMYKERVMSSLRYHTSIHHINSRPL